LKEKYAKDTLRLIPTEENQTDLAHLLEQANLNYRQKENSYIIVMDSTLSALPVLEQGKSFLQGFEVIQGTMDDVFLNAMKGDIRYV
jgi:multidrug/hemolysin transport system ATP-binding protein